MDSSQILTITVFVIVITIVGTIALAVVGYLAFRLRDRKHPSGPELDRPPGKPYFFERIGLPQPDDEADDGAGGETELQALPGGEPAEGEEPAEDHASPTGSGHLEEDDPEDRPSSR
ncbi:MAG: hypothetical protein ACN0LA_14145 [Candidatus Longimicrobiales bacterium M2_2A_002]